MKSNLVIVLMTAALTGVSPVNAPAEEAAVHTEAVLAERGIEYLDDAALRELIVGKTLTARNLESGEYFEARYGTDGKRSIQKLSAERPSDGTTALSAPYVIHDARVTTSYHGKVFEVRVYHVDGRYLAVRTADQGDVNWELVAVQ
ncbi:hypothetical protein N9903_00950 [bacterium]|nr:hypothetical protein [bacterium]